MNLTFHIDDTALQRVLEKARQALSDLTPAMHEIGKRYERRVLENFARESAPDGTPWPRLSAATLMMGLARNKGFGKRGGLTKKGKGYLGNKSMLVESGRLRSRVHYQADATSVRIGVNGIPYAAIHQFGGQAGRGRKVTIPARPWLAMNGPGGLALTGKDRQLAVGILEEHIRKALMK